MILAMSMLTGRPIEREKCYSYNDLGGFHILVLFQDSNEGSFIQLIQGGDDGQSTDELGNQAVLEEIFRLNFREQFAKSHFAPSSNFGSEPHRLPIQALLDNLVEPDERSAADEQNV